MASKDPLYICTTCKSLFDGISRMVEFTILGVVLIALGAFTAAGSVAGFGIFIGVAISAIGIVLFCGTIKPKPKRCPKCKGSVTIPLETPEGKRLYEESKK